MPFEVEMGLRLLLAATLGAIIGFQREKAGKQVGLRTYSLIAVGAASFAVVSLHGFGAEADPSRVAAGIVVGIGFLGAGVILHRQGGILAGLTTAATIWVVAGIGLAAGVGFYLIAAVIAVIVLIVLLLPHVIG